MKYREESTSAYGVIPPDHEDVMIDLETKGKGAGCIILSIGAVSFSHETGLGGEFYAVVNQQSCLDIGLTAHPDTVKWWSDQSHEAKEVLRQSEHAGWPIDHALKSLAAFISQNGNKKIRVWGNGADFDNAILAYAYEACGIQLPWEFYNNRCYRTLKSEHRDVKIQRIGTHHNALDDAKSQALHAIEIRKQQRVSKAWPLVSKLMKLIKR